MNAPFLGINRASGCAAVTLFCRFQLAMVSSGMEFHWRALWVFLLVFTAACLASRLDISIRHFAVPLVLLTLLLSPLPGMLASLVCSGWKGARLGTWVTTLLALSSVATAVRAYPNYIPFLNSLSMGRPGYLLVNDSNLDWNQALPEVERLVEQHGLRRVLLDAYGVSDPTVYVPQALFWNCQNASPADAGQLAVVSANMIADSHNCLWLLHYPHQMLADGSMYAFQLPAIIPPTGSPGAPPLPAEHRNFAGMPYKRDARLIFLLCTLDPQQLQSTMDQLQAMTKAARENKSEHP
jgi:hypothetical protein